MDWRGPGLGSFAVFFYSVLLLCIHWPIARQPVSKLHAESKQNSLFQVPQKIFLVSATQWSNCRRITKGVRTYLALGRQKGPGNIYIHFCTLQWLHRGVQHFHFSSRQFKNRSAWAIIVGKLCTTVNGPIASRIEKKKGPNQAPFGPRIIRRPAAK